MKILVTGGTGMVGSHVVDLLVQKGADVVVTTRHPERAQQGQQGARFVAADLSDPASLGPHAEWADAAFLLVPCTPNEINEAMTAVNIFRERKLGALVYLSVHQTPHAPTHVPHIGGKALVESIIKDSGIPYTLIRPNVFMQNDYWYKDALLSASVYPQPLGIKGTSMCDVRDIAEAAAITLTERCRRGRTYTIVGPEAVTGPSAAAMWSSELGKTIVYGGHDMTACESAQVRSGMPPWFAYELKLMYQAWQTNGLIATESELAELTQLLGRSPRRYEDFVRDTASSWLGTSATGSNTARKAESIHS